MRTFSPIVALLVLVLALVPAGCAGQDSGEGGPASALAETEANLAALESGDLSLRLLAAGKGGEGRGGGIEITGPFALGGGGGFPPARPRYTEIGGGGPA